MAIPNFAEKEVLTSRKLNQLVDQVNQNTEDVKQQNIVIDSSVTPEGSNAVSGAAVYQYVENNKTQVDESVSLESPNPVSNQAITQYVNDKISQDTEEISNEKTWSSQVINDKLQNVTITTETEMSDNSSNPVANKVIKAYVDNGLNNKINKVTGAQGKYAIFDASGNLLAATSNPEGGGTIIQGATIDDLTTAASTTWSSQKINTELNQKAEINDSITSANATWSSQKIVNSLNSSGGSGSGSGVGQTTADGGEIFNDYVNNSATGLYSHAEGCNPPYIKKVPISGELFFTGQEGEMYGYQLQDENGNPYTINEIYIPNAKLEFEGQFYNLYDYNGIDRFYLTQMLAGGAERPGYGILYLGTEGVLGGAQGQCSHAEGDNNPYSIEVQHIDMQTYITPLHPSQYIGAYIENSDGEIHVGTAISDPDNTKHTFIKGYRYLTDEEKELYFWAANGSIFTTDEDLGGVSVINIQGRGATGAGSHSEGIRTSATGEDGSHAEGCVTIASGLNSHAEGRATLAAGGQSHAEGRLTKASGRASHAEGGDTWAQGQYSHAEGYASQATQNFAHAEGYKTQATDYSAHAEGNQSIANGYVSHAEGMLTKASGEMSHAEGHNTTTEANHSHAEGTLSIAKGTASHVEGSNTLTEETAEAAHAEGYHTTATWQYSHAEGEETHAFGRAAHAEGYKTHADGVYSHAEGGETYATSDYTHAEGYNTHATNGYAHAEGYGTTASGYISHAEGNATTASGHSSHAEGGSTQATATCTHAEGSDTIASHWGSHVEGLGNRTTAQCQHVQGKYNDTSVTHPFVIGWGTGDGDRKNIFSIDEQGCLHLTTEALIALKQALNDIEI